MSLADMKALTIAACIRPHPAILLIYAEHETINSKIRKRLMPVRDERVAERSDVQELESLADQMIDRHPNHLPAVPRRILMQVLRVLQLMASGVSQSKAIREAEAEFKDYQKKDKSKKRVSFREGPHDERQFDKDDDYFGFDEPNTHLTDDDPAADAAAGYATAAAAAADGQKVGRLSVDAGDEDSHADDDDDEVDDDQSSSQSSESRDERETTADAAGDRDPDYPDFESEGDVDKDDADDGEEEEVESPDEDESEIEATAILSYDPDEDQDDELFVF